MAKIKIEDIVDHLSSEFRKALVEALDRVVPDADYDERELFRQFKRSIYRKCNVWEIVPDHFVEKE
jgi:hypothetical protein